MYRNSIIILSFYLLFLACKKEEFKEEPGIDTSKISCDSVDIRFKSNIQPIINTNCAFSGCHAGSGKKGVVLDSYDKIAAIALEERFLIAIKRTKKNRVSPMPKSGPLDAKDVKAIECWINAGRQNN